MIADELDYVLYEHENKYAGVPGDPSCFVNYKVPHVAYKRLYARAKAVLCQSRLHAETVKKNIPEANVVNLSGNVWTTHALDRMQELADAPKSDKVFLYDNTHPFKNLQYNQKFCEKHNITYDKIGGLKPDEFLTQAATYKAFVYFPGWLESLNRMAVECRMMRVGVVTDELLGAASEDWFKLEGHELIELMRGRRLEIVNKVLQAFD